MKYRATAWINSACAHGHVPEDCEPEAREGCCLAEETLLETDSLPAARMAVGRANKRLNLEGGSVLDTETGDTVWSL